MTTPSPTLFSTRLSAVGLVAAVFLLLATQVCSEAYYGKLIGKLSELHHGVSGEVYAVDGRTLFIKNFAYDGEAPTAYFYVGTSKSPNGNGIRLRDENGSTDTLKRYRRKDITLTLPDGKTLNNIKWFSVWCDEYAVNFGDVRIPRGFDYPKPQKLAALSGVHSVSSEPIVVVDAQTLLIPSFSYDGEAPDAKFWAGAGPSPSPQGIRIPDENGKVVPLRQYNRKTIVLTLPGDLTIHQIGHFGVWCEAFTVDFGHVQIPASLNVPPSLKMLGVSPQSKLNCEVLENSQAFEVRWAVAGDSIVGQLVGKLDEGQYMSFGVSANTERSTMVNGDVVVAWVDKQTLQGYAVDYFLDAKSQCSGGRGSCPDTRIRENSNSIRLLNAALVDGYSIVTYQRPLKASDELDHQILTNGSQAIIWAIGPLNERQEVSFHSDYLKTDRFIDFGRPPVWNCPVPDQEQSQLFVTSNEKVTGTQEWVTTTKRPKRQQVTPAPALKTDAWVIPPIQCNDTDDGKFYAQMGPTGGKHGYPAITGHVGWGISWYINGLLIPEIYVVRGTRYTFFVEGGEDVDKPALYHPFYITDDPVGGYQHKTPEEKAKVKIFAGAERHGGEYRPTAVGRMCNWLPDQNQPRSDEFATFGAYQRTLTLKCDPGEPGLVVWTPDENTPDTVYYQCFTHRYLGWKIHVLDSCDAEETGASETQEVYVDPQQQRPSAEDLENSSSIRVSSKVTPTAEFLRQQLHHPHREYELRYPYHSTTNPDNGNLNLNASYTQLLTTANNNNDYMRLQSSSSYEDPFDSKPPYNNLGHGIAAPHRHEVRVKEIHHAHLDEDLVQHHRNHHHHHYHHHRPQIAPIYREQSMMGGTRFASPSSYSLGRQQMTEIEQELLQQPSNQQLSNLVADNPRPLNHGIKYAYSGVTGPQILYSKPSSQPHRYATNNHHLYPVPHRYHHHHQPEQRTQLMFVKRPVLTRRPMLQSPHAMPQSTLPLQSISRPVFLERKKTVYRPAVSTYRRTIEKPSPGGDIPIAKLNKIIDSNQRSKLEAKVSDSDALDLSNVFVTTNLLKPARNTGFNPDSIVIEGGFKPIIRNVEGSADVAQKRISERTERNDALSRETGDHGPVDNFEPVFIPSPPVPTIDTNNKPKKKTVNAKLRSNEHDMDMDVDVDVNVDVNTDMDMDMEMAADSSNAYYLPPISSTIPDESPSSFSSSSSSSSEVLITFDGKRLKDSSLVRSISGIEGHSNGKLSSEILSRTPQFGRFKGDLPPPIPGEIRSDNSHLEKRRGRLPSTSTGLSVPETRTIQNTRLTLVERSRSSPFSDK
ncbi:protein Skeletor, isoforms B/C isoform X1 [Hylaeus anthracinus]|uniref:protein Skeletor, isoforms B/C isoform X1 n=1 Tax=Hylaeus anthracinus TaxID=313031 RepID=UPI0023B8E5F3|nr:protein Skeletor, isoforms B/C isoform X1 [Hylaeus anthracinus]